MKAKVLHLVIAFAMAFFCCLINQSLGVVFALGVCAGYEAYKLVRNHSKMDIINSILYMVINMFGIVLGVILTKIIIG